MVLPGMWGRSLYPCGYEGLRSGLERHEGEVRGAVGWPAGKAHPQKARADPSGGRRPYRRRPEGVHQVREGGCPDQPGRDQLVEGAGRRA